MKNYAFNSICEKDGFVPCPHCGHYQHLSWERFEYLGKGTNEADPINGVYFICEECDRPISEKYKTQMISQKQWRATAKAQNPGHIGFQLSRFYSPWVRWTDIALNYEAARHDPQQLQVFWNASLGLPYEKLAGEKLDWERLRDQAKSGTAKMLTNGGVAEYQIKSRKMRYQSLDELYRQRDRVAPRFARPRSASFADRLRLRIARRKNRSSIGGQNIGVSFCDF